MTAGSPTSGSIIARHCFDPTTRRYVADVTVTWVDGVITAIGPAMQGQAVVHDVGYLLPGLVDMHVHLEDWQEHAWRVAGVLTVRDVGCDVASLARWRAQEGGAWPTIECCGPFLETESATWPTRAQLVDSETAATVVDRLARFGARWLKAYSNIAESALEAVIREAHARDLRVTAHLGDVPVDRAVRYGLDGIEHALQGLYVASIGDQALPAAARVTLGPGRFWAAMLGQFADVDPDAPRMQQLVGQLGAHRLVVTPTLAIVEQIIAYGTDPAATPPHAEVVPRCELERWRGFAARLTGGWNPDDAARAQAGLEVLRVLVRRLHAAGAVVTAGSDAPLVRMAPGYALAIELQALCRAGLTPAEAVAAATTTAAAALGRPDVGSIAVRGRADLVGYAVDPLADLDRVCRPDVVVHGGVVHEQAALAARAAQAMGEVGQVPAWSPYGQAAAG